MLDSLPKLFISYCHQDKWWREEIAKTLKPYVRSRLFAVWEDSQIRAGEEWNSEIQEALDQSSVALLVVSRSFLASDYITETELPAIELAMQCRNIKLVWFVVETCAIGGLWFTRFQALHDPRFPLDKLSRAEQNDHLTRIGDSIKIAMRMDLQRSHPEPASHGPAQDKPPSEARYAPVKPGLGERFNMISLHSEGYGGQVWLARDERLDREIALKLVHGTQAGNEAVCQRFFREARTSARLEHPHIVPIYDVMETAEGIPSLAMRYLRGKCFGRLIAEHHTGGTDSSAIARERRRIIELFLDLCDAVAYAHSKRVLHRDIKPDNVVLGEFGELYLLDWGLSKEFDGPEDVEGDKASDRHTAEFIHGTRGPGTPAYMSPEQAMCLFVDIRTDVYGLGATLFEILTGRAPHGDPSLDIDTLLERIVGQPTPVAIEFKATAPRALSMICAQAMAKKRGERFQTVQELAASVRSWLDEEPLETYRTAVDLWRQQIAKSPNERSYQEAFAQQIINLGLVLNGMNRPADAEAAFKEAVTVFEKLIHQNAEIIQYRVGRLSSRGHLRTALEWQGRTAESEVEARYILEEQQALQHLIAEKNIPDAEANVMMTCITMIHRPSRGIRTTATNFAKDSAEPKREESETLILSSASPEEEDKTVRPPNPDDVKTRVFRRPLDVARTQHATLAPASQNPPLNIDLGMHGSRFRLKHILGAGGLGQVSLAHDEVLQRDVAIKQIKSGMESEGQRLLGEARLMARLEHPAIPPIHSFETFADGLPFFSMRLINGDSLSAAIRRYHSAKEPDWDVFRRLLKHFLSVCEAVAHAHVRGVIHRDLKPANILLDASGATYVTDWGIGKIIGEEDAPAAGGMSRVATDPLTTSATLVMGTPGYMSPEQGFGTMVDRSSDIYSLGVILTEIAAGDNGVSFSRKPFEEMLKAIREEARATPREINPSVEKGLDSICRKATAMNPKDRYDTASQLSADLENWMAGEPISSLPLTFLQQCVRRLPLKLRPHPPRPLSSLRPQRL